MWSFWMLLGFLSVSSVVAQLNWKVSSTPRFTPHQSQQTNPWNNKVVLDPQGKYLLQWEVHWDVSRVTFNVTVETRGYVGFGLSRKGKMSGADIVIGGVDNNGRSYFSDRHAIKNQLPEIDLSQDWTLNSAWERGNTTFLSFSRAFDTCDEAHDLPIDENLQNLIWAYGEKDDKVEYHFQNRGTYDVYILDPNLIPEPSRTPDGGGVNVDTLPRGINTFRIQVNVTLPAQDTLYWCSFHKAPTTTKQHVIGYSTIFPAVEDRPFVHHIIVYRCFTPPGRTQDEFFSPFLNSASACYNPLFPNTHPTAYCNEVVSVWGVGGRPHFFPEHTGIPITERGSEYFMMQTHFDNPNILENRAVSVVLEAYYTSNLRKNDLGGIWIGEISEAATSIMIPPSSQSHIIVGHCAGGCTRKLFPREGISVVGALLHTHVSGRGVRILQFRGNQELPWVLADDNFNFNFQQNRMLNKEVRIMPGDSLKTRCVYDTTLTNGSTVVGGFSTRQEMCLAVIWYYTRIPGFGDCRGEIRTREYADFIGIYNATLDAEGKDMVIREPENLSGVYVQDYANNNIDWDLRKRQQIQEHHLYQPHTSVCINGMPEGMAEPTPNSNIFPAPVFNLENAEHITSLPRGIPRYRRPPGCQRQRQFWNGRRGWNNNNINYW